MIETVVDCLTPPGSAAIAAIGLSGPEAWSIARKLFRPSTKQLPETPTSGSTWFGHAGADESSGDEAILSVVDNGNVQQSIEIHCHGGRHVVRWLVDACKTLGCVERSAASSTHPEFDPTPWA